jgi:hypothetical protein
LRINVRFTHYLFDRVALLDPSALALSEGTEAGSANAPLFLPYREAAYRQMEEDSDVPLRFANYVNSLKPGTPSISWLDEKLSDQEAFERRGR